MKRKWGRWSLPAHVCRLAAVLAGIIVCGIITGDCSPAEPEQVSAPPVIAPAPETPTPVLQTVCTVGKAEPPARAAQYACVEMTPAERDELAAVVWLETRGESEKGQQAVVEVVFNRILHSGFPDTVHEVLHQGEDVGSPQFSTAPYIEMADPGAEQYEAIDAALYGETILPADVVFFSRGGENDRVWGKIGGHVFCREYIWG